jgi:hypothetical protein
MFFQRPSKVNISCLHQLLIVIQFRLRLLFQIIIANPEICAGDHKHAKTFDMRIRLNTGEICDGLNKDSTASR